MDEKEDLNEKEILKALGLKLAALREEYNSTVGVLRACRRRSSLNTMAHERLAVLHQTLARFVPLYRALRALQEPTLKSSPVARRLRWADYNKLFDALRNEIQERLQYPPFLPERVFVEMQDVLLLEPDPATTYIRFKASVPLSVICEQEAAQHKRLCDESTEAYRRFVHSLSAEQRNWLKRIGNNRLGVATIRLRDVAG